MMYNDMSYVDGQVLGGLFIGIMFFSFVIVLIGIISYWKIFTKAGKPGWASLVPFYNYIVMLEIAKLPTWYIILFFIPVADIYVIFKINIEIAKKFGKSAGFGIGMTLLSVIFIPILAFTDNKYENDNSSVNSTTFDANSVINNQQTNSQQIQNSITNEPTIPIVEQVPPVMETQGPIVEQPPVMETQVPIVEQPPVMETQAPIVEQPPVMETQVPIVEQVPPVMEQQTNSAIENDIPIAFNVENQVNNTPIENISGDDIINNLSNSMDVDKICIKCGNKLPDIVSICPSCGTDNE